MTEIREANDLAKHLSFESIAYGAAIAWIRRGPRWSRLETAHQLAGAIKLMPEFEAEFRLVAALAQWDFESNRADALVEWIDGRDTLEIASSVVVSQWKASKGDKK